MVPADDRARARVTLPQAAQRRGLAAVIATVAVTGIAMGLTLPLIALLLEHRGASGTTIGLNTAMPALAVLAVTPLVPRLVRRFGAVQLCLGAIGLVIVSLLAFKLTAEIWMWFPLRFVLGAALTVLFATSEFWINTLADDAHRGRIVGLYAAVLSAGFAIGPAMLPFTGIHGWTPFVAGSVIALVATVPLFFARDLAPVVEAAPSRSVIGFVTMAPMTTFAALVYGAVEAGVFSLLPVYGVRIGMSAETAALMITAVGLGNMLCQVPIGWLADRMDPRWLLVLCALVGVGGAIALPLVATVPWLLWSSLFVWGGVVVGMYTVGLTLLGQRFSGADLAAANAAFIMMYGLGSLVGPPAVGGGMDLWNPHGLAVVLGVVCGVYVVLATLHMLCSKAQRVGRPGDAAEIKGAGPRSEPRRS